MTVWFTIVTSSPSDSFSIKGKSSSACRSSGQRPPPSDLGDPHSLTHSTQKDFQGRPSLAHAYPQLPSQDQSSVLLSGLHGTTVLSDHVLPTEQKVRSSSGTRPDTFSHAAEHSGSGQVPRLERHGAKRPRVCEHTAEL